MTFPDWALATGLKQDRHADSAPYGALRRTIPCFIKRLRVPLSQFPARASRTKLNRYSVFSPITRTPEWLKTFWRNNNGETYRYRPGPLSQRAAVFLPATRLQKAEEPVFARLRTCPQCYA